MDSRRQEVYLYDSFLSSRLAVLFAPCVASHWLRLCSKHVVQRPGMELLGKHSVRQSVPGFHHRVPRHRLPATFETRHTWHPLYHVLLLSAENGNFVAQRASFSASQPVAYRILAEAPVDGH